MTKLTKEQKRADDKFTAKKSEIQFTKRGNGPLVKDANGGKPKRSDS